MDVTDVKLLPKKYYILASSYSFHIDAKKVWEPGILVAGIANHDMAFDLLTCYASILPENGQNLYACVISQEAVDAFQINGHVIDYDQKTTISCSLQRIPVRK